MATNWERLQFLTESGKGLQFGFTAEVIGREATTSQNVVGSQVIKFTADPWDINPWRIYLGAWIAKPGLVVPDSQIPFFIPLASPEVPQWNVMQQMSFDPALQIYARVKWGSGGAQHVAYVDWPIVGLLCQTSGSYVEVSAVALRQDGEAFTDDDLTRLPDLPATLSDEPGGGDSNASATFTYPFQAVAFTDPPNALDPGSGLFGLNFPVPPFARSVRLLLDSTLANGDAGYATTAYVRMRRPQVTDDPVDDAIYVVDIATYQGQAFAIPPRTAYVRVDFIDGATEASCGAIYELDL